MDDGNRVFGGFIWPQGGGGSTDLLREGFDIGDLDVDGLVWQVFEVQAVPRPSGDHSSRRIRHLGREIVESNHASVLRLQRP